MLPDRIGAHPDDNSKKHTDIGIIATPLSIQYHLSEVFITHTRSFLNYSSFSPTIVFRQSHQSDKKPFLTAIDNHTVLLVVMRHIQGIHAEVIIS